MSPARTSKPPATIEPLSRSTRRWVFPAALAPASDAATPLDVSGWLIALGAEVTARTGLIVTVGPTIGRSDPATSAFVRSDGLAFACDMPRALAAALVGQRCGGAFDAAGVDLSAPSVARVHHDLLAAACRAADMAWPVDAAAWTRTVADKGTTLQAASLVVAGQSFDLRFAVTPPPSISAALFVPPRWSSTVAHALAALPCDLRVVLHDVTMPLDHVCRLRVGDIVPIDPGREVVIRVGDHALARGTIAPDGRGGHRITLSGVAARGITNPVSEDER